MGIFDFFKSKSEPEGNFIKADMHSHLLPGLDDGVATIEESITLIKEFKALGFTKLITTPHIMGDFYKNTADTIGEALEQVIIAIKNENIDITLEAAAEYYLDEWLMEKLENKEPLLTFGDNYVLFETSFLNEPSHLKEAIFLMASQGYKPVFAHPERYIYLYSDFSKYEELFERGVLFQLNLNSLSGYYSRQARIIAEKLINSKMVHFVGTDCHGERHLQAFKKSINSSYFGKLSKLELLNNTLE